MRRVFPPKTGETHHVYTKSIYHYVIFPSEREYLRMIDLARYFRVDHKGPSFSRFIETAAYKTRGFENAFNLLYPGGGGGWVEIKAYCLMPTHIHFILRQTKDNGIRTFISRLLTSFSLYFNRLHNRKGPLWQERFGASFIRNDAQLAEKIDYVHDNPVKDLGMTSAADWPYSSYRHLHGLPSGIPNLLTSSTPGVAEVISPDERPRPWRPWDPGPAADTSVGP